MVGGGGGGGAEGVTGVVVKDTGRVAGEAGVTPRAVAVEAGGVAGPAGEGL